MTADAAIVVEGAGLIGRKLDDFALASAEDGGIHAQLIDDEVVGAPGGAILELHGVTELEGQVGVLLILAGAVEFATLALDG